MDLICIGLNHKTCPVEIREKIAFSESALHEALLEMRTIEDLREWFILSTCNRVELYGRGLPGIEERLIRFLVEYHGLEDNICQPYFYRYRGRDAAKHLFRVSSGLDSLVIGENEIYGQIRHAFRLANELKTLDSILYQLIERSLRLGKRARSETKISEGAVSVSSIAVELAEKIFGRLTGERVLILGTGKMSELTMKHLVKAGAGEITVASRTYERALELSQKFGAKPIGFDAWLRVLRTSDIVISSTSAPHPIVKFEDVQSVMKERRHKPLFFIDIAVPRDVDPRIGEMDDVYLYDIDDLKTVSEANLRLRKKEIAKCEAIIERELESFDQWYEFLEAGPVIQKLTAYFDSVVENEIAKVGSKFKGHEDELKILIQKIKAGLLHVPVEKLKESARMGSIERYLETLHSLFRLEERKLPQSEPKDQEQPSRAEDVH
ncbi:MAG: glutamyl-tRNA reductase [Omnitrophica bacterium RIFCSPHIGHO2_02_FULL_46_11]|nr:MAG: glutamyl-tRNA reductase [Omnitrophica bacterium RIFCSPLOWO2_01_FULL_45_10b]OGW87669.1 MAG: glutamyl-tRNA reductase [Omnitrophica bacterium RIFCSPHIGHO2_02_FULL_46_11]